MPQKQEQLLENVIRKWESFEMAIDSCIPENNYINNYINDISESLESMRNNNFKVVYFGNIENSISLIETKLDEFFDEKIISKKLWEIINLSLLDFLTFVGYLKICTVLNKCSK
jgi:uncharacterized protein YqgQ